MNKTAISWTNRTFNPVSGCSIVSDGCAHCYAMHLSLKRGWTEHKWTQQNEHLNVQLKPHKLTEAYGIEPGERVFVNSMSDLFHRSIPDWYRAAIFAILLDLPANVFQILTKRPELAVDWHTRYHDAIMQPEFIKLRDSFKGRHGRPGQVYNALLRAGEHTNVWASHIWMGSSVEDARVLHRIDTLRKIPAQVRFISAEPLLGPYPADTDLTGIHWVIVGGESGDHMEPESARWMQQAWARGIRDLCLAQGVAFFYKQDSAKRTEVRTALEHESGYFFIWNQYPGNFAEPRIATPNGREKNFPTCDFEEVTERWEWVKKMRKQRSIYWATQPSYADDYEFGWEPYRADEPLTNCKRLPKTFTIYTAQMRDDSPDTVDTTIKSASEPIGKLLAPTWELLNPYKAGSIDDTQYEQRYRTLIASRLQTQQHIVEDYIRTHESITLKCYCAAGDFCHRHIALEFIEQVARGMGYEVIRGGERRRQQVATMLQPSLF